MNYHRIEYGSLENREVHPNIEAIELRYAVFALEVKQCFPNVKRLKIENCTRDYSQYQLQLLCDSYSLEELIIINVQKTLMPNSLWTSNLRQ
jgi:hypothetical protein